MNFRLANVTAIVAAAVAFVIVPGIYVLTSNAATNLVEGFGTTRAASRSNRIALEAEAVQISPQHPYALESGILQMQNGPEGPPASPADAPRATSGVPPAR